MSTIRNILWISYEDISPRLGCYGDPVAQTPNLDRFASEGCLYRQATCTAPICAPSRAAVITGMYAPAIGCHHMRTSRVSPDLPELPTPYEAVPPPHVKTLSEYLRSRGFFCTNNGKNDYQFGDPASAWDLKDRCLGRIDTPEGRAHFERVHWRQRPDPSQPFFAVFNLGLTHESGQWPQAAGRVPAVTNPDDVRVPPYLPDTPASRQALAQQYDHIAYNDQILGELLQQLEDDGLADSTAVFMWSDHGEGLPRRKSWPYFSGSHVPLIVRAPGFAPGSVIDEIASLIDLAPTVLDLLKLPIPAHMQGQSLADTSQPARTLAFSHRDRIGESYDHVRAVHDRRFTYLRNRYPYQGRGPMQAYRHKHPIFQELYRLERDGALQPEQRWLFAEQRPTEELYDRETDPHELNNLAANPAYAADLTRLRQALDSWQIEIGDMGDIDELEMVRRWYPDGTQPVTGAPMLAAISAEHDGTVSVSGDSVRVPTPGRLLVQSATQGASVEISIDDGPWRIAPTGLTLEPGTYQLRARAHRYGYAPSDERAWSVTMTG